jgi:hypothetical protein
MFCKFKMKVLKSSITYVDSFGVPVSFRINKDYTAKTFFGGILTLILFLYLFIMMMISISSLLNHENPIITLGKYQEKMPKFMFGSSIKFLLFQLDNLTPAAVPKKYFTVSLFKHEIINGEFINHILDSKHCDVSTNQDIQNSIFAIDDVQCSDTSEFLLYGSYIYSNSSFISIHISPCSNETENGTCAPLSEIEDYVKIHPITLALFLDDININLLKFEESKFAAPRIQTLSKFISVHNTRFIDIFLSQAFIETDNGILYKGTNTNNYTVFDYYEIDETDYNDFDFITVNIFASMNSYTYQRSYKKIPDLLASLGGMSRVFQIIFLLMARIFSVFKRDQIILNKVFDYDIRGKDLKIPVRESEFLKEKSSADKTYSIPNTNSNIFLGTKKLPSFNRRERNLMNKSRGEKSIKSLQPNHKEQDEDDEYKELMKTLILRKNKSSLKIHFREILIKLFCPYKLSQETRNKFILYQKSIYILNNILDISSIIGKLEEFEKLKFVIFNRDQYVLFEFISKYVMSLNQENEINSVVTKYKLRSMNTEYMEKTFIESLKQISREKDKSNITKKLFAMINPNICD